MSLPLIALNSLLIALTCSLLLLGLSSIKRRLRRRLPLHSPVPRFFSELGISLCQAGLLIASLWLISEQDLRVKQLFSYLGATLAKAFTMPLLSLEGQPVSLLDIGRLFALAIGLWLIVKALTRVVRGRLLKVAGINKTVEDIIALAIQLVLMSVGLLVLLQAVGINIGSIAILLSVVGVGIGFGLQNISNNLISGMIILLERPIQAGDFVNVGDLTGLVRKTGIRITEIETLDKISILVPNSELIEKLVVNWSHGSPVSRLHVPFGVAYGSSIADVRLAALTAAQHHPKVLRYPKPEVWFQEFGDSSLRFDLLIWIREPWTQERIKSDINYLLEASFRHYAISIPFPQRDVHVKVEELGKAVARQASVPSTDSSGQQERTQQKERPGQDPQGPAQDPPDFSLISQWCAIVSEHVPLTEADISDLVARIQGVDGVEIKDRKYGISTFKRCFIGSEAVDWIVNHQDAAREEAVAMGKELVRRGIVRHVTDDHDFEDRYLFYCFPNQPSTPPGGQAMAPAVPPQGFG